METTQKDLMIEKFLAPEHQIRIYRQKYHKKEIVVLELDHQDSRLEKDGPILKFPKDYANQIRNNLDDNNYAIAPEYCVPDLYRNVYRESSLAATAYIDQPMIAFVSRLAGATGRKQIAADPANKIAFGVMELAVSNTKFMFQESFKDFLRDKTDNEIPLTGNYGDIRDREVERSNTNDSRHLLPARAYMGDVLRGKVDGVYHITTPIHAERVDNYIKRQIDWENDSTIKVDQPVDLKFAAPTPERNKMNIWYKGPVVERNLREYSPTLPRKAYEIDLFFHHDEGMISDSDKPAVVLSKLTALKQRIDAYTENGSEDKNDRKYQTRLKLASKIIGICEKKKWLGKIIYKKLSPLIDTNRIGWKLTRKDYIY